MDTLNQIGNADNHVICASDCVCDKINAANEHSFMGGPGEPCHACVTAWERKNGEMRCTGDYYDAHRFLLAPQPACYGIPVCDDPNNPFDLPF
jgi:hypothetical protein